MWKVSWFYESVQFNLWVPSVKAEKKKVASVRDCFIRVIDCSIRLSRSFQQYMVQCADTISYATGNIYGCPSTHASYAPVLPILGAMPLY